ncbi:MAG: hypothetical protein S4CHLAM37_05690 [Chlamydiia bacterium]|nr:hypothetical protein [Chlamydiia bacterium]
MNISRESIFISAIRSFCNAFFAILGIVVCVVLIAFLVAFAMGGSSSAHRNQISLLPDAEGNRDLLPITSPAILKINIDGIIGTGKLTTKQIESKLLESQEGMLKNNRIKGILLHIDTPGGGVTDSNGIYEAIKAYKDKHKIPVFAYVDGMCASGGMYISSATDRIYSSEISIIGSVGVILGPVFNFHGFMEKWGIKAKTIAKGKDKAMLNPFTDWKTGEDQSLYAVTDYMYKHFVELVVEARPKLNKAKLINDYGAQVYIAPTAAKLGYIDDGYSSYTKALTDLTMAAGIKSGEKYQVVELKTQKSFVLEILESQARSSSFGGLKQLLSSKKEVFELNEPFLYLYQPN